MTAPAGARRVLKIAGGTLLVVVAAWAGFKVYSSRMPHSAAAPASPPAPPLTVRVPAGAASPPRVSDTEPLAPAIPAIPAMIPDFSLKNRSGKLTPIAAWRGKSLIINFWATWCAPCRHEIPLLMAVRAKWQTRGVEVIGIAVDHPDQVNAYADKFNIPYPLLIGEDDALDAAAAFGVDAPAFPFTVFTDRRGEVVALFMGELHEPQAELMLATVQRLNGNELTLVEARRDIAAGLAALSGAPASGAPAS